MLKSKIFLTALFFVLVGVLSVWINNQSHSTDNRPKKLHEVHVSDSSFFVGFVIYIAREKGYFAEEGLDILFKKYPHGKANLAALVKGEVDFANSSETPFMHSALSKDPISTIATMITSANHLSVVADKSRGIEIPQDLRGKKIGVTLGSNGEYFLDTFLILHKIPKKEIEIIDVRPNKMIEVMSQGQVDAVAIWNPLAHIIQKSLGEKKAVFFAKGLYSPWFQMAVRKEYAQNNPEIIESFLRALQKSVSFIQQDFDESVKIVAQSIQIDPQFLLDLRSIYHFKISLEQDFLLTLENQSRWAIKRKLTGQTEIPNYFDYIYFKGLEKLDSASITIIR